MESSAWRTTAPVVTSLISATFHLLLEILPSWQARPNACRTLVAGPHMPFCKYSRSLESRRSIRTFTVVIDEEAIVKTGARIGPYSVVGRQCHIEEHAVLDNAIVWANSRISQEAVVRRSILGRHCHIGRNALVEDGVVLGDKSVVTDYSRLCM